VIETTTGAVSFSVSFGVSLGRISELKRELRDAWTEFGARPHDIKAALRFVRAAFQGGGADVVEDLQSNSKLVDAVPILADMYSPDEAARIALIWGQHFYGCQQFDLATQILQDLLSVAGINSALVAELKDSLRSIHYGIAQSRSGDRKASPATRVVHLNAILRLLRIGIHP
jgi:hypothetical protein